MIPKDILDQAYLSGEEVNQLNFIKHSDLYIFRKYYRSGLRSHIFEVLLAEDVKRETQGVIQDGIRIFPRAKPQKMFRIFRSRFDSKEAIFFEIKRYKILLEYLGREFIALSEEFIADYRGTGFSRIVLCGLQEYVPGEILDPFRLMGKDSLHTLLSSMPHEIDLEARVKIAELSIKSFVKGIRSLMEKTGYIPDLAGVGNLILTPGGDIKLVDINNIVDIRLDNTIHLDDKGYPACDVSVQVLSILEKDLLGREVSQDPIYAFFLTPERCDTVKKIEQEFYKNLG